MHTFIPGYKARRTGEAIYLIKPELLLLCTRVAQTMWPIVQLLFDTPLVFGGQPLLLFASRGGYERETARPRENGPLPELLWAMTDNQDGVARGRVARPERDQLGTGTTRGLKNQTRCELFCTADQPRAAYEYNSPRKGVRHPALLKSRVRS
jgi:hypothetical protein